MPQSSSKFIPLDDATPTTTTTPVAAPVRASAGKFLPLEPSRPLGDTKLTPEQEAAFQHEVDQGHPVRDSLPFALGTIGLLAGPEGAAAGAATGRLMQHTMEKGEPLAPWEAIKDAAITGGSTYLGGRMLGPIENKLVNAVAGALFQRGVRGIEGQPISRDEKGNIDFSQEGTDLLKDAGLNLGFNVVGGKIINKLTGNKPGAGEPFSKVTGEIRGNLVNPGPQPEGGIAPRSTPQYGAAAQTAIRGNLSKARAVEKAAFDEFRNNHIATNTEKLNKLVGMETSTVTDAKGNPIVTPKIEQVEVKGPIYTANTQTLAQEVLPKLDEFMKGETFQKLPPPSQSKYAKLYGTIKDLATPFTSVDSAGNPVDIPIKEWETIKDVRTDINKVIGGKPAPNFPEAGLKKLADTLGQDVDMSINNFWKNGPDASAALAKANKATEFKKQVFNREIQTRLYGKYETGQMDRRVPADPSEVFKEAYKSPEKAQRLMTAMGPDNEGFIKGDYFDNVLMKKAFGPDLSKFNPSTIVQDLENPNSVSRVILNADERNNLLRFARAARSMGEEAAGGSLSFNKGRFVLNLGLGASRILTGSSTPGRIVIGAKQMMEAAQQSKLTTDLASRLMKIRPETMEAQQAAKSLIRAFRGVELNLDLDGEEKAAKVNDAGKLVYAQ